MTITEIINNVFESTKERIKNPLAGSFICSFVVYNWRPIFLLIFSEATMEDKIQVINNTYCYPLAILIPLLFAIIYTMYLPFLMVKIDTNLIEAKKDKISNLYFSKDHTLDKKMEIAAKELRLKDIETGNKDRQELIDQIDQEKRSHEQIVDSYKSKVTELTNQLGEIVEAYKSSTAKNENLSNDAATRKNNQKLFVDVIKILMKLSRSEYEAFFKMFDNGKRTDYPISNEFKKKFVNLKLVETTSTGGFTPTNSGVEFIHLIKNIDKY